ncbi:MAG: hypothetical protein GF334_02975 [Candidatus Altiarchaeales archaeon]|nr:hypothetical protein [Candidatus Altiarchaeales archaeon]
MDIVKEYIGRVEKAVKDSDHLKSKLSSRVQQVGTMHEKPYLHLVNNLCSYPDVRHLHVGFWKGGSLFAALDSNPNVVVYANDSFFGKGLDSSLGQEFAKNSSDLGFDGKYKLITDSFREVSFDLFEHKINFLLYDAAHDEDSQYQGVYRWDPILDDVFILLVDDWNHYNNNPHNKDAPKIGTMRAIEDRGYKVHKKWELNRHVGQGIFVLEKS